MSNELLMWENTLGQIHLPATPVLPKQNRQHPTAMKKREFVAHSEQKKTKYPNFGLNISLL